MNFYFLGCVEFGKNKDATPSVPSSYAGRLEMGQEKDNCQRRWKFIVSPFDQVCRSATDNVHPL